MKNVHNHNKTTFQMNSISGGISVVLQKNALAAYNAQARTYLVCSIWL